MLFAIHPADPATKRATLTQGVDYFRHILIIT